MKWLLFIWSHLYLFVSQNKPWCSSPDLPLHLSTTFRYRWTPWRKNTACAWQMMASCSERNLMYEHTLQLALFLLLLLSLTLFYLCSTFINSYLSTVFALRVRPWHIRGSEQRRKPRKEQISKHSSLWVISTTQRNPSTQQHSNL